MTRLEGGEGSRSERGRTGGRGQCRQRKEDVQNSWRCGTAWQVRGQSMSYGLHVEEACPSGCWTAPLL